MTSCSFCNKPAGSLQCPTCLKLSLPASFFCSQECFKQSWPNHKLVHEIVNVVPTFQNKIDERFSGFHFTGPLRPGSVSPRVTPAQIPKHIKLPDYAETGVPVSEQAAKRESSLIAVHTPEQIKKIRKACKLGREVLDIAGKMVKIGTTTSEINRAVHNATIERDSYPSPLNYYNFPKSCCTSVNEIICHGIPDNRELQDGDICNVDISLYHDGYHSDLNETFLVGNVAPETRKLVQTTYECLEKAIEIVKPGVLYREVGNVISKHAHSNGYSVVRAYCGHGIGELFHATPSVPHYGKNKAIGVMKPGHVFTIEPMISAGTWHDVLWPDNWTSATKDGKCSAQFEHGLLVTQTGCEILTKRTQGSYLNP